MIFSLTAGSSGSGEARFVARLPLALSPGLVLQIPNGKYLAPGPSIGIQIEKLHYGYAVTLGPFSTSKEAEEALSRMRAAALWSAIELSIGLQYPTENSDIQLSDQPTAISENTQHIGMTTGWTFIDGHYDAQKALIIPDEKRLASLELGKPQLVSSIPINLFIEKFEEALSFEKLGQIAINEKLKLAIEVAMSHRFEVSERAQFIALVTSLEALLPDAPVSDVSRKAITEAIHLIKKSREQYEKDSRESRDIERLLSQVKGLERESIGERLQNFVEASTTRHPTLGSYEVIGPEIRSTYNLRSKLLHQGHIPSEQLVNKLEFLRAFVPKLLRLLFIEASNKN